MSVFDNHLDQNVMDRDNDRMILEQYKISNSGNTLIPKKGSFGLSTADKKWLYRRGHGRTDKLPSGTFKEERSVFRSMYGSMPSIDAGYLYPIFEEIIRDMNLPCLVYNNKRYYNVNREVKRQISHKIHNRFNVKESNGI